MGPPLLIGAGLGAITSAAMGKNPFMGALLGGATGGLFGGAGAAAEGAAGTIGTNGLIGGANLTGAGIASGSGASAGGFGSGLFSGLKGIETAPVSFGTGGYASGIGGQALNAAPSLSTIGNGEIGSSLLTNSKGNPLNMMDKVGNYVSNIPSNAMDYVQNNPLSSAKMALDVATPAPEAPMQDRSTPIKQGNTNMLVAPNFNTNPSSNLDTSLQIGQTKDNRMGLLDALKTRIPLTDEEKAQLSRLNQRY